MNADNRNIELWPDPAGPNLRRSVLAQDLVVEGDVTSRGPVDVNGQVDGSLHAPNVLVAGSGRIDGSIVAHDLAVLGVVTGTISSRKVQLMPSAIVHADIVHEQITIEAGAELNGRLSRRE